MNIIDLATRVRQLTGVYSSDVVPQDLIYSWLNEAYAEVSRERDWDWLEFTEVQVLPAWQVAPQYSTGAHIVELDNGTRRILSAYLVDASGSVEEMVQVPTLNDVEPSDAGVKYDVNYTGVVRIAPEQDTTKSVKIRYTRSNLVMLPYVSGEFDEIPVGSPLFADEFHSILAYRAAINVLAFIADDTKRADFYAAEFDRFLEGMVNMYELNHDYRSFQLGQDGVETRKYFPWFRPA